VFRSLRGYDRDWLRGDLVAGLTVWAVLIPEALAHAAIAGVSPVVGLYAAPGALLLYAALGSSRHLVTGPMSATAALIAGLLRLGFLASFISEPVIKGFIVGLALTIIVGQVPDLLREPRGGRDRGDGRRLRGRARRGRDVRAGG
jgi:MFS superfamily sulfate permease-like transporter